MHEKIATVKSERGLHARPACEIAQMVKTFPDTKITLINPLDNTSYDADSVMSILTMFINQNEKIIVRGSGEQEKEAVEKIANYIETFSL